MSSDIVLLVEDKEDDVFFFRAAFERLHLPLGLGLVRDGSEAIDYLKGVMPFHDRERFPLPRMILLDLHMPRMDGFEVLKWLRAQPRFGALPVVVLAASSYSPDVKRAYQLGASSFLVKSSEPTVALGQLKNALDYWLLPGPVPAE